MSVPELLIKYSGASGRIIHSQSRIIRKSDSDTKSNPVFFAPVKSKKDLLLKPAYIATAPVCMLFISFELIALSALNFISVIVEFPRLETKITQENLDLAAKTLYVGLLALFLAAFSPIVNLVDCVGSLFTEVEIEPEYNMNSSIPY